LSPADEGVNSSCNKQFAEGEIVLPVHASATFVNSAAFAPLTAIVPMTRFPSPALPIVTSRDVEEVLTTTLPKLTVEGEVEIAGAASKEAVMALFAFKLTLQEPVPEHPSPDHPVKIIPESGVAVKITVAPVV